MEKQLAYKAFTKELKCKYFQFEVGQEFQHKGKVEICNTGFHSCLNPFDILNYYDLTESRFAEVEIWGKQSTNEGDSKIATEFIFIKRELSLKELNTVCIDFLIKECEIKKSEKVQAASGDFSQLAASGYSSKLAASGYFSKLAASGYSSKLAASGDSSKLEITGRDSVGANIGINGTIKATKGTWITLAEYKNRKCICVVSAQVDGKKIKENVWLKLSDGKIIEA